MKSGASRAKLGLMRVVRERVRVVRVKVTGVREGVRGVPFQAWSGMFAFGRLAASSVGGVQPWVS